MATPDQEVYFDIEEFRGMITSFDALEGHLPPNLPVDFKPVLRAYCNRLVALNSGEETANSNFLMEVGDPEKYDKLIALETNNGQLLAAIDIVMSGFTFRQFEENRKPEFTFKEKEVKP